MFNRRMDLTMSYMILIGVKLIKAMSTSSICIYIKSFIISNSNIVMFENAKYIQTQLHIFTYIDL
jgi:hypothetical protein